MSSDKFAARVEDDTRFALLAEKIRQSSIGLNEDHPEYLAWVNSEIVDWDKLFSHIADQFRSVDKEARDKERESVVQYGKEQRWEARTAALEEAAKVADAHPNALGLNHNSDCCKEIADRIRKLKGERG